MTPIPHLYESIPGYADFTDFYAEAVRAARPGAVLVEVGVGVGRSLAFLAVEAANANKGLRVIGVDSFAHENFPGVPRGRTQREHFEWCTAPIRDLFEFLETTSVDAASLMRSSGLNPDLVFIDASHDLHSVFADCCAWWETLAPGGTLAGDDYDMIGVRAGVHQFAGVLMAAAGVDYKGRRHWPRNPVQRMNGSRGWGLWKVVKPSCVL